MPAIEVVLKMSKTKMVPEAKRALHAYQLSTLPYKVSVHAQGV